MIHTHPDHLERWLGAEEVARLSVAMRDFYWPIAVHGVPGNVKVMPGGDFTGRILAGSEASAFDRAEDYLRRERRRHVSRASHLKRQAGAFGSLDALVAAATGGKAQNLSFNKVGVAPTGTVFSMDLWYRVNLPAGGAAGGASPGGTVHTSANTGALGYTNPSTANTGHFTTGQVTATIAGNTLLLYDRLFSVAKTMNSVATQAVTGVPTRYQSGTGTAADYIGGNFCYPVVSSTVLPATAHNHTVCQYTDQGSNAAQSFASATGVSACAVGQIDIATINWFLIPATGDFGVKALTQMQTSALVATGTLDFVVAHPLAFLPCPVANMVCIVDGLYTAFNLVTVFDNACLSFLELTKPTTGAVTYNGMITVVSE